MTMAERKRDKWDRPIESLFAQVGYCVGLGNLWRFPYLCQKNGGGAFLIPYALSLLVMSIPLYIFEVGLGQAASSGKITAFNRLPLMRGIGVASFILSILSMIPYMLVMTWGILYFGHSFTVAPLPWTTCDNPWNTNSCVTLRSVVNKSMRPLLVTSDQNISLQFNQTLSVAYTKETLAHAQFWRNYVLRISNPESGIDGMFNWPVLCGLFAAFVTVFFVNRKGVKFSGKVVKITATFPYVILLILLVRGATLDGASQGIKAYLLPEWPRLAKPQVWVEAVSQAIYTFGIGSVATTAFGGYNKYKENFYRSSFIVVGVGSASSFTMGLATFSVLGHLAHVMGVHINDVVQSGPGLVFQVFPVAVGLLPASQFWSALFFLMIYFVAVDTSFSEFEGQMSIIGDAVPALISTPRRRAWTNAALGLVFFILCLPQLSSHGIYIFELINWYGASNIAILFIGLCEAITVGWLWNAEQFKRDVLEMTGSNLATYIVYCYKYFTPLVAAFVLVFFIIKWEPLTVGDFVYPTWANVIGWTMCSSMMLCIPLVMVYVMWKGEGSIKERFQRGLLPISNTKQPESQETEMKMIENDECT